MASPSLTMVPTLRRSFLYFFWSLSLCGSIQGPPSVVAEAPKNVATVDVQGDVTATTLVQSGVVAAIPNTTMYPTENDNIRDYLNPKLFEDPATLQTIQARLRAGHAVTIRNAFRPDFAETMHQELMQNLERFQLHVVEDEEACFTCKHHNMYDSELFTELLASTGQMFESEASKEFMKDLSGRECSGSVEFSASWFQPGDNSMPHSDWFSTRTVAYVWHLTKNWKDGYGGALYWCNEHPNNAWIPPSFNTLILFNVNAFSHHLVTEVNSLSGDNRRLAINGWYTDEYEPSFENEEDLWENYYTSVETLMEITSEQYTLIDALAAECASGNQPDHVSDERCAKVQKTAAFMEEILHPEGGYNQAVVIDLE